MVYYKFKMRKKVSVIIPTFNRAAFLPKAINSVLNQSFKDFELIVVDDGSTDKTYKVVSSFSDIVYIRKEHRGPSSARNRGIEKAKGEFVAFLDSDDWWDKDKLKIQIKEMEAHPEYPASHTQEIWYKNGKILNQKKKHKKYGGFIFDKCLPLCAVSLSTAVLRRQVFDAVGLFDESLPCCEDYDFWLRVSARYPLLLIDKPLTLKDGGRPDQVSTIYARGMDKFRIQSIVKILQNENLKEKYRKLAIEELKRKCNIYGNGCIKHGKKDEGKYYLNLPLRFESPQ
jgi:glycosyltransferase involved in cell wall biosynthesis